MAAEEKTEQATPKRKQDERKEGNVFKSQEIITLASLAAVFFTLQALAPTLLKVMTTGMEHFWTEAALVPGITASDLQKIFIQCAGIFAVCALPTLLVAGLVAFALTMFQTKGLFATKSFSPKFSRLSPAKGIKRVFSMRGLIELLKAMLKISILGYMVYSKYVERFKELPRLMGMDFISSWRYGADFIMDIVTTATMIFAFLAAADYMYQRWQYEKDLRMTKQEIKEEYKQTEGDPQIKGKIKEKQRQMAMSRMMQDVPTADVVIRNPTHYAVALRYVAEKNHSPQVLAKGADLMALRIVKIAQENEVMVVENKPLARGIYETVPLEHEIPEEFFGAVAEVLAYVYSTQKKRKITGHDLSKD